jgi:hypothetical protein
MRWLLWPAALCAVQLAAAAAAEQPKASDVLKPGAARPIASPINDRFAVRGSYFPASISTTLRLDAANGGPGTELAAERDFGMSDKQDQGRIELTLRLRERHRMRFDYFKLTRNGDAVLTRNIDFGDETFVAADRVLSLLDWRTLNFTYLYSIFHRQRFELAAGAGLHILDGEARARVPARVVNEEKSGVTVFPTLALDATWRISRRFALTARANRLSASLDDSSGSFSDYHADVQYRWRPNLAMGAGYTALKTDLQVGGGDFPGHFVFDVDGPELFIRASF